MTRVLAVLCVLGCLNASAKKADAVIDSLWSSLNTIKTPVEQVPVIKQINFLYFLQGRLSRADSAFSVGLNRMKKAGAADEERELLIHYFADDETINPDSAVTYLDRLRQLIASAGTGHRLDATIAAASYLNSIGNHDSAIAVLTTASINKSDADKNVLARYYFQLGTSYKYTDQKVKAFENLSKAVSISQQIRNDDFLGQCFLSLSDFYRLISNSEMTLFYDKKLYDLLLSAPVTDSIRLIQCLSDMGGTYIDQGDSVNGLKYFHTVIDFAERNNYYNLKAGIFRIYRTFLVRNGSFASLYKLYRQDFPEEYEMIRNRDVCEFNRLSAFMAEGHGAIDSARYFYRLAEECLTDKPRSNIFVANFLKRYGEFLMRQRDLTAADSKFQQAFNYAAAAHYLPYMVDVTAYLDSVSALQQDYARAYHFARLNKAFTDSLAKSDRNNQLLQLEIRNEQNQLIYQDEQEKLKTEIRHRIQLSAVIAVLLFLIVIVVIVQKNFRVQQKLNGLLSKEKKRSEDLLLNILPAEVAEELKDKGSAEARFFEPVTVMFTDFKSFTRVSERLSPQQLVNELDCCFREFDHIMKRHNIEKIKTVGDAYLAVSGLPVADTLHAVKMVNAALEISEFMKARKEKMGDDTFEIRIGLHSGGVVAGIVGVSKFAYDVWGDTVNTAARMEQNCEPGRINISETTYQLVKNQFSCQFRGKIAAKNKGDLNMYFVD